MKCNLPKHTRFFTPEDFFYLWDKVKECGEFQEDDYLDRTFWMNKFFRSNTIPLSLGDGMCWFENVIPNRSAQFSFLYFDKRLTGREKEIHAILKWGFDFFNIRRVTMIIPDAYKAKLRFSTKKVGFSQEGLLRDYYIRDGVGRRAQLLGILKKEIM